jgi:hypothetical protein
MTEQELRSLVREAIERHLGRPGVANRARAVAPPERLSARPPLHQHASHVVLTVIPGSDMDDGMCVIEPAVKCNHCGFCQSYGH